MTFEALTILDGPTVLARAKEFFAERVPLNAAFPEKEGAGWLVLRGQGGEEVAIAVRERRSPARCARDGGGRLG